MDIEYPIEVKAIEYDDAPPLLSNLPLSGSCGDFVSIRPARDTKTYLGVVIGAIPLQLGATWDKERQVLTVTRYMYNPAIFVPELGKVVFGIESWWGKIKSPDDLRQISDQDINNVWYVQCLKKLQEKSDQEATS